MGGESGWAMGWGMGGEMGVGRCEGLKSMGKVCLHLILCIMSSLLQ